MFELASPFSKSSVKIRKLWRGLRSAGAVRSPSELGGRFRRGHYAPQLGFEPDSFDLGLWLRHEFTNRFEDDPKLAVVFLFQFIGVE